jgi:hypothetical protein
LSEYHSSKNERVERKYSVAIAGYILVSGVYFFVKALEAFFTELFVMR